MPELPEVEVSRMGVSPHLIGKTIDELVIRQPQLRWPVSKELGQLKGSVIKNITRRAKYLLIHIDDGVESRAESGTIIVHLGMSGSLRVIDKEVKAGKHDHIDLVLTDNRVLRYNDPRRFGAWLWQGSDSQHPLLVELGPEPLSDAFDASYIIDKVRGKKSSIKSFIMNNKIVVGVGNIYANEALFSAGIHPLTAVNKVTDLEWEKLVLEIKQVLATSIEAGGTTLKDFSQVDGKPGYFAQELKIYGKADAPCPICQTSIEQQKIAQRNSYFCPNCQPIR